MEIRIEINKRDFNPFKAIAVAYGVNYNVQEKRGFYVGHIKGSEVSICNFFYRMGNAGIYCVPLYGSR